MITSKRDLKKHIERINDEVVQSVLPAAVVSGVLTEEKAADALTKLADLTHEARARLAIAFDKSPKAFPSVSAYKAARTAYYKQAYAKALADYEAGVNAILSEVKK